MGPQTLTWKLIPKTQDELKPEIVKWAAFYEHRIKTGSKVIFHLEAFVAKYMRLYERYVLYSVFGLYEFGRLVLLTLCCSFLMGVDFDD